MNNIKVVFGGIAGILSFIAFIPYIVGIIKYGTRPNRASWIIWLVLGFILAVSYYSSGAQNTMWVPVSYVIGPLIVIILALKKGEGGWNKFDKMCLAGALMALIGWRIFNVPLVALVVSLLIHLAGSLSTIKKSYLKPYSESLLAWIFFSFGHLFNIFAIEQFKFAIIVYPVYMFLSNGLIASLLLGRRKIKKVK